MDPATDMSFIPGQTFKWLVENSLGYAGHIVSSVEKDASPATDNANHLANKTWLVEYVKSFPEGREAVRIKGGRDQIPGLPPAASTKLPSTSQGTPAASFSKPSLFKGLLKGSLSQHQLSKKIEKITSQKLQPCE